MTDNFGGRTIQVFGNRLISEVRTWYILTNHKQWIISNFSLLFFMLISKDLTDSQKNKIETLMIFGTYGD